MILFSEKEGTLLFQSNPVLEERAGVAVTNGGYLTTVENGLPSADYQFVAVYVRGGSDRLLSDHVVTIEKRVYPESIEVEGDTRISEETTEFT
jgi:hypothetical protein